MEGREGEGLRVNTQWPAIMSMAAAEGQRKHDHGCVEEAIQGHGGVVAAGQESAPAMHSRANRPASQPASQPATSPLRDAASELVLAGSSKRSQKVYGMMPSIWASAC